MKHNLVRRLSLLGALCVLLALLSACAEQNPASAGGASQKPDSAEDLQCSEPIESSEQPESSEQSGAIEEGDYSVEGRTNISLRGACTIEMNGKSGYIAALTATGDLPIVKIGARLTRGTELLLDGEGPISIQIDEGWPTDVYVSNRQYSMSVEADKPALFQASAEGATLKPTEPTELERYAIFVGGVDGWSITFSGRVEELLQITREDEGVYLVEGLSGAGEVECKNFETNEIFLQKTYEAGENRNFRIVCKDKTATLTEVEP